MHARNRTWPLGSDPAERCRQRTLPVEGGDGSTLSLDFTTGVLDPRLTFTRSTNATFINSSGLVEWANANMYWNTAFEGLNGTNPTLGAGTGWAYVWSNAGTTAVFTDGQSVTMTATADQRTIGRSSGFTGGGLRTITVVDVEVLSGNLTPPNVITGTNTVGAEWYINGSLWSSGNLPTTPCTVAFVANTATAGTTTVHFGVGANGAATGSVRFSNPRWTMWKGSVTAPYYPNTSATNSPSANYFKSNDYQAPRFDYDPTTLAPRGLLIEGQATNALKYSEQLNTAPWFTFSASIASDDGVAPDGNTTADSITPSSAPGGVFNNDSFAAGTWTYSVWAKANPGNTLTISVDNGGNGRAVAVTLSTATAGSPFVRGTGGTVSSLTVNSVTVFPNSWRRISLTVVTTGSNFVAMYNAADTNKILIWGAQLETGSGASSYIPTGASQGTRNADECSMTGTNFSSWYNSAEGSIYVEWTGGVYANNANGRSFTLLNSAQTNQIFEGSGSALNVYLNTFQAQIGTGVGSAGPSGKVAGAFKQDDFAVSFNGGAVSTDTSGSMPTAVDRLSIGSNYLNAASFKFASIKRIKYWPTRLPNAQLQSLTT
jgi:hypothetical protein